MFNASCALLGLTAEVIKTQNQRQVVLTLELVAYDSSILRLRLKEKNPLKPRYEVPDVLVPTLQTAESTYKDLKLSFGPAGAYCAVINADPFRVDVYSGNEKLITLNDRNLLKYEELQERQPAPKEHTDEEEVPQTANGEQLHSVTAITVNSWPRADAAPSEDTNGAWEEGFGSHTYFPNISNA